MVGLEFQIIRVKFVWEIFFAQHEKTTRDHHSPTRILVSWKHNNEQAYDFRVEYGRFSKTPL